MTRQQVFKILRKHEKTLHSEYHVESLYLFGSVARGDSSSNSDIDLLVEFSSTKIGFFEFLKLQNFLQSILRKKVDLVAKDALKEWMKASVERDAIRAA